MFGRNFLRSTPVTSLTSPSFPNSPYPWQPNLRSPWQRPVDPNYSSAMPSPLVSSWSSVGDSRNSISGRVYDPLRTFVEGAEQLKVHRQGHPGALAPPGSSAPNPTTPSAQMMPQLPAGPYPNFLHPIPNDLGPTTQRFLAVSETYPGVNQPSDPSDKFSRSDRSKFVTTDGKAPSVSAEAPAVSTTNQSTDGGRGPSEPFGGIGFPPPELMLAVDRLLAQSLFAQTQSSRTKDDERGKTKERRSPSRSPSDRRSYRHGRHGKRKKANDRQKEEGEESKRSSILSTSSSSLSSIQSSRSRPLPRNRQKSFDGRREENSKDTKRGKINRSEFCQTCEVRIDGSFLDHKRQRSHRRKVTAVQRGCDACSIRSFDTFRQYEEHCGSKEHRQKHLKWQKEQDSRNHERLGIPEKTIPVARNPNGKETTKEFRPEAKRTGSRASTEVQSTVDLRPEAAARTEPEIVHAKSVERNSLSRDVRANQPEQQSDVGQEKGNHRLQTGKKSTRLLPTEKVTSTTVDRMTSAEVATGREWLIPVTGYFCKLCSQFFNAPTKAEVTKHCASQRHRINAQDPKKCRRLAD